MEFGVWSLEFGSPYVKIHSKFEPEGLIVWRLPAGRQVGSPFVKIHSKIELESLIVWSPPGGRQVGVAFVKIHLRFEPEMFTFYILHFKFTSCYLFLPY